jgi:hypothetical protein
MTSVKVDVMDHKDFLKIADTGDLLLFRGKSIITKIQRTLTMSDYDHVALLLRYSTGRLVILEATA